MTPSSSPLRALAQRLYPMAQQAYKKWEQMPQEEKDRYIKDAKERAAKLVKNVQARSKGKGTGTTSPPATPDPDKA